MLLFWIADEILSAGQFTPHSVSNGQLLTLSTTVPGDPLLLNTQDSNSYCTSCDQPDWMVSPMANAIAIDLIPDVSFEHMYSRLQKKKTTSHTHKKNFKSYISINWALTVQELKISFYRYH